MKKVNWINCKDIAKNVFTVIAVISLAACTQKQYIVKNIEVARVEMDDAWEPSENTEMRTLVNSYKVKMTEETQIVIGTAKRTLTKDKPQSLLSNFIADAIFDYAAGLWGPVDFALANNGGIRNILNQGQITIGNMYEIFPFNNRIVLLELQGEAVKELFNAIANAGGECLSKNIEVVIKDKAINSLKIGGITVDDSKIYRIATIDYLAEGNDRMGALTKAVKVTDSNILMRDAMIEFVKKQTSENKAIDSNLDNRITIIQ
jgi:2',3'-cyclic-nucleotide 2'-phosphodiesterase (5'-nucleotidase family)